jgi:hypothetical protein
MCVCWWFSRSNIDQYRRLRIKDVILSDLCPEDFGFNSCSSCKLSGLSFLRDSLTHFRKFLGKILEYIMSSYHIPPKSSFISIFSLNSVKWGRLHNNNIYKMKTKIDTNVSTCVYYEQVLRYMFRPFLGHHQASHKNTKLCSWIWVTLIYVYIHISKLYFVFDSEYAFVKCDLALHTRTLVMYGCVSIVTRLGRLETPFGLVIGFINNPQVVTTITYNTVTHLRSLQSLHANLLSLPSVVFTYS